MLINYKERIEGDIALWEQNVCDWCWMWHCLGVECEVDILVCAYNVFVKKYLHEVVVVIMLLDCRGQQLDWLHPL